MKLFNLGLGNSQPPLASYRPQSSLADLCFEYLYLGVSSRQLTTQTRLRTHKGDFSRQIGRTRGGLNSKLHAVCDGDGKPVVLRLTAGQVSDYCGADTVLDALPEADILIADKGYDSDRLREALAKRGVKSCIPGRAKRKEPIVYVVRR